MERKLIKKVLVNQADMVAAGESREVAVFGDVGAEFNINIIKINDSSKESYYNFKTDTFTEAFVAANNLQKKLTGNSFSRVIIFPAENGEVYSIKIIAKEQTTKFINNNFVDTKNITQVGQSTIGIQVPTVSSFDNDLISVPSAFTSTGSTALSQTVTVPVSFVFKNKLTDGNGFGLRLPGLPDSNQFVIPDNLWYSQQVLTVNGTHDAVTDITFDTVTNVVAGMEVANSQGVILVDGEKVYVTSVSSTVVGLSAAISVANDAQLTFKAYGPSLIKSIFGQEVEFSGFVARGTPIQKQVRTDTTFPESNGNVTLNLNGTYGLGGGNHVRLEGFNMNNSGNNNLIVSVSPSSTAGSVVINYSGGADDISKVSTVPVGTKLNVKGSYQDITVTGNVKIKKYPNTNVKVVLDTEQIITAGTTD